MERMETTIAAGQGRVHPVSYLDWPAILGGTVVAAGTAAVFTAFGSALGLASISAEPGEGSFTLWIVVTAIWTVLSLVASYLAGGYVAGRMRRRVDEASADEVSTRDGINGLVVWGLGMLVGLWMAASLVSGVGSVAGTAATAIGSTAGGVAQGAGTALGGAAQGVAQAVGAAVPEDTGDETLTYITDTLMRPAIEGTQQSGSVPAPERPAADDAELARQVGVILGNVVRTGEISDEERAFLTAAVAQRTDLSQAEVEARVTRSVDAAMAVRTEAERMAAEARAAAEQAAAEARDAAIAATEAARKSGILTAFLLTAAALVAGAAAVIGAVRGGHDRDEGRLYGGLSYRP